MMYVDDWPGLVQFVFKPILMTYHEAWYDCGRKFRRSPRRSLSLPIWSWPQRHTQGKHYSRTGSSSYSLCRPVYHR